MVERRKREEVNDDAADDIEAKERHLIEKKNKTLKTHVSCSSANNSRSRMLARAAARLAWTAAVSLRASSSSEAGVAASLDASAAASPSAMAS